MQAYRARWVITLTGQPVENGVILVHRGKILRADATTQAPCIDLGNVAIIPGLVNAHTHLEFSDFSQPIDTSQPFPSWLKAVVAARREHQTPRREAIRNGLAESVKAGVTLIGDIATKGWVAEDYAGQFPGGVVFQEMLGLGDTRVADEVTQADQHLRQFQADRWSAGLSPHAPSTVHPHLFAEALRLAQQTPTFPVAMHLAETEAEVELLQTGNGPLRDFLHEMGVWRSELFPAGRSIEEFLDPLSELDHASIIHGNYLERNQLAFLARHPHMTLIYCPRTHAAFGHGRHPWIDLVALGGSVAVGTDSRASNPDLNLWAELQHIAAAFPDLVSPLILQLGTINGARALGFGRQTGTLAVGKRADLAVVSLRDPAFQSPWHDLFAPGNRICGTMVNGEWAHLGPELLAIEELIPDLMTNTSS